MPTPRNSFPSEITNRVLLGLAAVVLVGFLIQLFAPLRIDTDAGYYLAIGASFAEGHGLRFYEAPSPLPVGYPIIVALIDRAGLGSAAGLVGANLLFLVAALTLLYPVLRTERDGTTTRALFLIVMFLSSFVLIKYFPRPRSEEASLLASWAALWCLTNGRRASGRRKVWLLVVGALLIVPAISIRAVGIALIPVFAWALVPPGIHLLDAEHRGRFRAVLLGSAVLLGVTAFWAATSTDYLKDWLLQLEHASLRGQLYFIVTSKLNELGQLALNVPDVMTPPALRPALKGVGFVVCLFIVHALWRRRRALSPVDVFVLANLGILFIWPGNDPRFWLPISPFVGLYVVSGIPTKIPARARAVLAGLYLTVYVALGIGVQAMLTREAFSEDFATTYGDGSYSDAYKAIVEGPGQGTVDDSHAFRVLLRYDARASEEWDRTKYQPFTVCDDR